MSEKLIKNIQFKRGLKAILEARLVENDLGVPKIAEPIYESDTGKLKIGDGEHSYKDLPYISGEDARFIIQDPLEGQVLLYDETIQAWVNKNLADKESIIYLAERGLTLQGFDTATHGQMLVKDIRPDGTTSLVWTDPVSLDQANTAAAFAEEKANAAANSAQDASNASAKAQVAEVNAKNINKQTMEWVNGKFWWGTLEEYNEEIAKNGLNPGTFYFVRP